MVALYNLPEDHDEDPQEWINHIAEMIESGDYDWALDTLFGIGETIETQNRVTPGQVRAINNIQHARKHGN